MPADEQSKKPLTELKPDKKKMLSVYCPVVDRTVLVAKWYDDKNKGDINDIGNPKVYYLMCDQSYKEYMERSGSFDHEKRIVQEHCGQNRRCPKLLDMWNEELGIKPALPQEPLNPPKPSAKAARSRKEKMLQPADDDSIVVMEELVDSLILNKPYSRRVAYFLRLARGVMNMGDYKLMMEHLERAKINTRSDKEENSVGDACKAIENLYRLKYGQPDKKV
jgi:hypothetical protein